MPTDVPRSCQLLDVAQPQSTCTAIDRSAGASQLTRACQLQVFWMQPDPAPRTRRPDRARPGPTGLSPLLWSGSSRHNDLAQLVAPPGCFPREAMCMTMHQQTRYSPCWLPPTGLPGSFPIPACQHGSLLPNLHCHDHHAPAPAPSFWTVGQTSCQRSMVATCPCQLFLPLTCMAIAPAHLQPTASRPVTPLASQPCRRQLHQTVAMRATRLQLFSETPRLLSSPTTHVGVHS